MSQSQEEFQWERLCEHRETVENLLTEIRDRLPVPPSLPDRTEGPEIARLAALTREQAQRIEALSATDEDWRNRVSELKERIAEHEAWEGRILRWSADWINECTTEESLHELRAAAPAVAPSAPESARSDGGETLRQSYPAGTLGERIILCRNALSCCLPGEPYRLHSNELTRLADEAQAAVEERYRLRIELGETKLVLESTDHNAARIAAERDRLKRELDAATEHYSRTNAERHTLRDALRALVGGLPKCNAATNNGMCGAPGPKMYGRCDDHPISPIDIEYAPALRRALALLKLEGRG